MAYLNRGQFYALTLSDAGFGSSLCQPRGKVLASGAMAAHGLGGNQFSGEKCAMGGPELQQDSIVQVREEKLSF